MPPNQAGSRIGPTEEDGSDSTHHVGRRFPVQSTGRGTRIAAAFRRVPIDHYTDWPSVPRQLPIQTPDLLANTSLAEPAFPPYQLRPPSQAQLSMESQARAARRTAQRQRQEERAEERRREVAAKAADLYQNRLLALYKDLPQYNNSFTASLSNYRTEDLAGFNAFFRHIVDAHVVSDADVRVYDIIRWYKNMPAYVRTPLEDLCGYYHREAIVRQAMKASEIVAGSWQHPLSMRPSRNDEAYAAGRTGNGEENFGFEHTRRSNGFGDYRPRFEGAQQLKHLTISLRVRKVRLRYLIAHDRLPNVDWDASLEKQIYIFALCAKTHVNRGIEGVAPHDEVLLELKKHLDKINRRYRAILLMGQEREMRRKEREAKLKALETAKRSGSSEEYKKGQIEIAATDERLKELETELVKEAENIRDAGDVW